MQPVGINFACPQCGREGPDSWETSPEVFALMKVRKGNVMPIRFSENEGTLVKPYFCVNCGYALLFRSGLSDLSE